MVTSRVRARIDSPRSREQQRRQKPARVCVSVHTLLVVAFFRFRALLQRMWSEYRERRREGERVRVHAAGVYKGQSRHWHPREYI